MFRFSYKIQYLELMKQFFNQIMPSAFHPDSPQSEKYKQYQKQVIPNSQNSPQQITALSTIIKNNPRGQIFHQQKLRICQIVGNFANSFIITYNDGKLYLIDQHAASQKNLFLTYLKNDVRKPLYIHDEQDQEDKVILIENVYKEILKQGRKEMEKLGWKYKILSEGFVFTKVKIECLPCLFGKPPTNFEEQFLQDIEKIFEGEESKSYSKSQKDSLATVACHNAVRVGDQLSRAEMRQVVDILTQSQNGAFNCPHGRPIITGLGKVSDYFVKKNQRKYCLL